MRHRILTQTEAAALARETAHFQADADNADRLAEVFRKQQIDHLVACAVPKPGSPTRKSRLRGEAARPLVDIRPLIHIRVNATCNVKGIFGVGFVVEHIPEQKRTRPLQFLDAINLAVAGHKELTHV